MEGPSGSWQHKSCQAVLCVYRVCWHVCQPALLHHAALRLLLWYEQVGEGSIAALSTGGAVSKFGFPLQVRLMPYG